jgi:actin-related protein 9
MPSAHTNGTAANPAAAASTGASDSGTNAKDADGLRPGQEPRGPGVGTEVGEENEDDNEGVLDVAAIVARDNAAELLAKREAEKAARAAAKKGAADAPKQVRLKNSEREKTTFTYEEYLPFDSATVEEPSSRKRKREVEVGVERFMAATPLEGNVDGILEIIASAIHRTALAVVEPQTRSALWDNLIILGNGARAKGKQYPETVIS